MEESDKIRLHAIVVGNVQGVGFRAFVIRNANRLGLSGWVRNRWDYTVEVVAEGEREPLDQLLSALRRGPSAAMVTQVKPNWGKASSEFEGFRVKYG
jgi:acylphosphatase